MALCESDGLLYAKEPACGTLCFIIDNGDPVSIKFFQKIKLEVVLDHKEADKVYGESANDGLHHSSVVEVKKKITEETSSNKDVAYTFGVVDGQERVVAICEPDKEEEVDDTDSLEDVYLEVQHRKIPKVLKTDEADVIKCDEVASKIKDVTCKNLSPKKKRGSGNVSDTILNHDEDGRTSHRVLRSKKSKWSESKKPQADKRRGKGKPADKINLRKLIQSSSSTEKRLVNGDTDKKTARISTSEKEIDKTKLKRGSKWQTACEVSCQYCLKVFENQQAFYDHKKTQRSVSYPCEVCKKSFPFKAFLQAHVRAYHMDGKVFSNLKESEACICDVCGSEVKNMFALKKHLMFHTDEYFYKCCICGKQFVEPGTLNNHMTTHKSGGMIRCKCCNELFATRSALAKHKLALLEVKCHLCGQSFPNRTSRTQHYKIFHQNDILKCSKCTSMFSSQEELAVHMEKHNLYKKKQCTTCGKFFSRLEKHIITHKTKAEIDESELFVCDKCPRKFSNRSSFQRHLTIHSQEKPYQCPNCPRTFADCGVLRKHLRRHSSLMPYECEVCGKKCKEPGNLKVHMRIHSDTKQFPCPVCPQAFNYKSSLEGHMRSRHSQNSNAHGPVVQVREAGSEYEKIAGVDRELNYDNASESASKQYYEDGTDTSMKQHYEETSVGIRPVNLMPRSVYESHPVSVNTSDVITGPKHIYGSDSITRTAVNLTSRYIPVTDPPVGHHHLDQSTLNVTSLDVTTVNVSTMNVSLY